MSPYPFDRCLNDFFGYCRKRLKGKPSDLQFRDGYASYECGGSCRLKPATCGRYYTLTEYMAELKQCQPVKS